MPVRTSKQSGVGDIELLQAPDLPMTADAILKDFTHYFGRMLGRRTIQTRSPFLYQSVVFAARDRLMERWARTRMAIERDDNRRTAYLSLEFLMGRLLRNALLSLGIERETAEALGRLGIELEESGRARDRMPASATAASAASPPVSSTAAPPAAAGHRLRHSLRVRHVPPAIVDGDQVEEPEHWLREAIPGRSSGPSTRSGCNFGGRTESYRDASRPLRDRAGVETNDVLAIPYDVPFPATATARSIPCACGRPRRPTSSTSGNSMPAAMRKRWQRRMPPRTSPWCSTPMTPARTARNCACASSISSPRPACRTSLAPLGGTARRRLLASLPRRTVSSSTIPIRAAPCPS